MTADLIHRLRTACSPVSPLGILCSEAAEALEKAERERDASKEEARMAWSSDEHQAVWAELKARAEAAEAALKEAVELLKPMAKSGADIDAFYEDQTGGQQPLGGDEAAEMLVLGYFQHVCMLGHLRAASRFIEARTGGDDAVR